MTQTSVLLVAVVAALLGALLGYLIAHLAGRSRLARLRAETAERLAAAQTEAAAERERREKAERSLEETQAMRLDLEKQLAVTRRDIERAEALAAEQREFVEKSRKDLENAFQALARGALEGNTKQFLDLAEQRFRKTEETAKAELEKRKQAIAELLNPLRETLGKLEEKTGELEVKREKAYTSLEEQIKALTGLTSSLGEKTNELATALRGAQFRGQWGEIALKNIAELAGMTEHCDFEEQETVEGGGRPDMVVRLPGGRFIAVDSKAPLSAYLDAVEAGDEKARDAALDRHVQAVRGHIRALASRDYAAELGGDVDLVVMFLPGDPFLAAAFSRAPDLQVEALRSKVLVATPTTLVALLRTVAIYWNQQALAENAQHIAEVAREFYERVSAFAEHLGKMSNGLRSAVNAFNKAVGSFQARLKPMGTRLEELKAAEGAKRRLQAPEPVEVVPREVDGASPAPEPEEEI